MSLISIEAFKINPEKINRIKEVETILRDQNLEQISDQLIIRQVKHDQQMSNGEMVKSRPYYGNSLPLITRAGKEIYELRTQTALPTFNLISLPQYRVLKKEDYSGVFSLGPGFKENGSETLNLLMVQLFYNELSFTNNVRTLIKNNFEIISELPSRIFGKDQYLFFADGIK